MNTDSILEVVHQTATGLHRAGLADTMTMREFDALCLPRVKQYSAKQIKDIRIRQKASQSVFAAFLNTSVSTLQKWERGETKPRGSSLKLLNVVEAKGLEALI